MNRDIRQWLKSFTLELVVYAVLVVGYYFLVLHLVGDWLNRVFHANRPVYAGVALGLIIIQGVVLEGLTRWLLRLIKPDSEDE
jgi:hypothetical protein